MPAMNAETIRDRFFPMHLPSGVTGRWLTSETARKPIQSFGTQIFDSRETMGLFVPPAARQAALEQLGQQNPPSGAQWIVFFNAENAPVGWFYGYREPNETFFIDTVGLIPVFRRRGIYTAFLKQLVPYLATLGYERLATSHSPNNRAILIAELKLGFNITGIELHESCGPLIKTAYLFYADRQAGFDQVFTLVPHPMPTQLLLKPEQDILGEIEPAPVTLRSMLPADEPTLLDIAVAAWTPVFASFRALLGQDLFDRVYNDWQTEKRRQISSACHGEYGARMIVAAIEDKPVGFCSFYLDHPPGTGEIGNNAVHPAQQGKGVGTLLYQAALAEMKKSKMRCAKVTTGGDTSHAPARRAYAKAGFERGISSVTYFLDL